MFRGSALICLAALLAAGAAQAQPPAPAAPAAARPATPAAMFGPRESVTRLDISPSGRYAVYVAPAGGTASTAVVADLVSGGDARPIVRASGQPERLSWCRFVSDSRLICAIRGTGNLEGQLVGFDRIFSVNADGSNIREMGQQASLDDARIRQFSGDVLDWLPQDGNAVLMVREYVPEVQQSGSRTIHRADGLGVDRVDINSLHVSQVEPPDRRATGYMSDGRGNVRMMIAAQTQSEGQLRSQTNYYYRLAGARDWRRFSTWDDATREGMLPLAIDGARDVAYVLKSLNGRLALYRVKLDDSLAAELVYANDHVDVDNVVRIGRAGAVVGVTFAEAERRVIWFDPQYAELSRNLSRALPGQPAIDFAGASLDENKLVILARGATLQSRPLLYLRPHDPRPRADRAGPARAGRRPARQRAADDLRGRRRRPDPGLSDPAAGPQRDTRPAGDRPAPWRAELARRVGLRLARPVFRRTRAMPCSSPIIAARPAMAIPGSPERLSAAGRPRSATSTRPAAGWSPRASPMPNGWRSSAGPMAAMRRCSRAWPSRTCSRRSWRSRR